MVPCQHVKGGEIVLNVSPMATNRSDDRQRPDGVPGAVQRRRAALSIPVDNVTAIYARETGHGMAFDVTRMVAADDEAESGRGPARDGAPADGRRAGGRGEGRGQAARTEPGSRRLEAVTDGPGPGAEVIAFGPDAAKRRRRGPSGARSGRREGGSDDVETAANVQNLGRTPQVVPTRAPDDEQTEPAAPAPLLESAERDPAGGDRRSESVDSDSDRQRDADRGLGGGDPGREGARGEDRNAESGERDADAADPAPDRPPEGPPDGEGGNKGRRSPRLTRIK